MSFHSMQGTPADLSQVELTSRWHCGELFVIVWLDVALKSNDRSLVIIKEQLQMIINDIEIFNDADKCIDYITDLKNGRVLFVMSGFVDQPMLMLIQDLSRISAIYVLNSSELRKEDLSLDPIRKMKGNFNNVNTLIEQIKFDIRRSEHELIDFEIVDESDISSSYSRNLNKQETLFMYSQLLKDVFLKLQDDSTSELAEYCRTIYSNNPSQLALIDEFERDYNSNEAIRWYTRDTFLYRLVNEALRTHQVEILYNMRTFIRHLHQHLSQLCPMNNHVHSGSSLILYRGQKLPKHQAEKILNKEGRLLSVSSFLSTSASRAVAMIYAGESDNETIAMIFIILLDLNSKTNSSFACVEQFSQFGTTECEWLFSIGTVFRIEKMELIDRVWNVHLTLTNDQDEMLEKLSIHMKKLIHMDRPNPLVPLIRLFARMGAYKKAEELCKKHITLENEWEMEATLYDTLALIQVEDEKDILALEYHEKALNIVQEHVEKDDPLLASYYSNVAISCSGVNQHERAIEHYRIAIELESKASQPDYTNIAYAYDSMGHILHYHFEEYNGAMSCYEDALKLMLEHLPSTHPDIVSLYDSMADIYEEQGQLNEALEMLYKSVDILEKNSDDNSYDLVRTYKHIAEIYNKQEKFEQASEILNKAHTLQAAQSCSKEFDWDNIDANAVYAKIFKFDNN